MSASDLLFEREIDLPRVIVFDALVEPDLVVGWLAQAIVEPVSGGRYDLEWLGPDAQPPTAGIIVDLDAPTALSVQTDDHGLIEFALTTVEGGLRGSGTLLRLRVRLDMERAFAGPVRDAWETRLDRLEELLRGHPVGWTALPSTDEVGSPESDDRFGGTPG
ncbi:SRPBCC domain-containing protein [Glaciihabitans sp. UYNi722]|uniref:SRPBCC domain-containing protein n=1 Tax=Glaciihabitans sp. UYNi722 TaxID=3156344 RepID=UPI00339B010C